MHSAPLCLTSKITASFVFHTKHDGFDFDDYFGEDACLTQNLTLLKLKHIQPQVMDQESRCLVTKKATRKRPNSEIAPVPYHGSK